MVPNINFKFGGVICQVFKCWPFLLFRCLTHLLLCVATKLQEMSSTTVESKDAVTGHIISTTIGGENGEQKQVIILFFT